MKRLRDEVYVNPQFKRPLGASSSRGESFGQSQPPPGTGNVVGGIGNGSGNAASGVTSVSTQKLTTNDALSYLKQVKDMFQDRREKYDCFLDVMKDFKAQRIDTAGVIARVKELFKGHPNLILGFNTFLPKGYEITLTDDEEAPPKKTVEFEEAISFVNKIKKRFQDDDRVYKSFLDILNMYRKEHKSITEVYGEVATLFGDHPDLLDEFTRFLPDSSSTTAASHGPFGRHSFHSYDDKSSVLTTMRQPYLDKRQHKDRLIDSSRERDQSVEPLDLEEDKSIMKLHKEQKKYNERENKERRNRDTDDRDHGNDNHGDISMHRLSDKRKAARKVDDIVGTSNFASFEDKDASKGAYSQEFLFCEKVKARLHSPDDYQAFLKCLHLYSTEIINRQELQGLVANLLGKYPDLLEGFNEFFERCERIDGFLPGVIRKKSSWNEGGSSKTPRVDDNEKEQRREGEVGKEKEQFNSKCFGKSIQELDLSNSERCTPSYRLLPDDYPIMSASQRSDLGHQVLNDKWVSVTSGSEDYSFKHMRRNQYEESLFRCEDDRFELDMLLESVSSTSKRAEELLNSITDNTIGSDGPIQIEDHFTALNLRCIERLYGDHGLDVMEILRKNPSLALPVILTRLKQKQEEWTKCRSDFNKVWAEIYQKNHYKSLDHRSFYFKQQDSKNLSSKSLVAEIKEIRDKMLNEDDALLTIAAGSRHSLCPHMEFEYADADVHDDIFRIIKHSCEEICSTKDQLHKVLRFWTSFLEPMLGVRSRIHGLDPTRDDVLKRKADKGHASDMIECDGSQIGDATVTSLKESRFICDDESAALPQVLNLTSGTVDMDGVVKEGLDLHSGERSANHDIALTSRPDVNHAHGPIDGVNNVKRDAEDGVSSEGGDILKLNRTKVHEFGEVYRISVDKEDSVDPCAAEKEEGELSPNGDFEDNFAAYQESTMQNINEKNAVSEKLQPEVHINEENGADVAGENDVDADDEDSENNSEAGEDVSGSESVADESSREEHEEEEDVDHDDLDGKVESEGEDEIVCDTHSNGMEGASLPLPQPHLQTCKPLCKHISSPLAGEEIKERRVLYGNDSFYVLFRLHQTLYERILFAKLNSISSESKWRTSKEAADPNARFMSALFSLLDGSSDNTKYEDDCRFLIGNQSYVLFTLDKLIYKLVKQLQNISSDEMCCKLLQLFDYEKSRKPLKYVDSVNYENVHVLLHDENIYRLECSINPTRLSIQLMDDGNEKSEVIAVSVDPSFATYLYYEYLLGTEGRRESSAVAQKRNMRKYSNLDEASALNKATENTQIMNGLECKMASSTSKISYVLDTEDYFIRLGERKNRSTDRSSQTYKAAVRRFHQFLDFSMVGY